MTIRLPVELDAWVRERASALQVSQTAVIEEATQLLRDTHDVTVEHAHRAIMGER